MGIFKRLLRKVTSPTTVVTVAFRDLDAKDPLANFSPEYGYAYLWPFSTPPQVGDWAVAPGIDGPAPVIVGALGAPASAHGLELKSLLKEIPGSDVAQARAKREEVEHRWLDYARSLTTLPTPGAAPRKPPAGFDPLPPAEGPAGMQKADEYGRAWWRAYALAGELGRSTEEVEAFKSISKDWFKLRDEAEKKARTRRMATAAATIDLRSALRRRSREDVDGMLLAGQPLWDWLAHAQDLQRAGQLDEALAVVEVLIEAAEREAQASGREPAPAYTERAAIIYRKRRDYAAEVAVLERWNRACPPERRGPGASQAKLLKRLERARELAQKA
ncbi:hypothetical protein [Pseudactinotalea sp. Z1748]|uniref:hypothetical protein n=1 Tax=Pseudactinotalea sp. Z1748 TaxID=3413027 RepID=UPI003C79FF75